MKYENYEKFVINYQPFEWEVENNPSEFRETMKGKHSFISSYIRFYKVFLYLQKIKERNLINPKIFDVGAFPGNMVRLSKTIFENISEYCAIGLDLDDKFTKKMKEFSVRCIDTEIDPKFPEAKKIIDWEIKNFDVCLFLDTIEHLVDPIFCLDQINKSLKLNGYLIITTDNITNFLYITEMIRKGKSPNVHPVLSSMVYKGNHRPHHKEFSKEELEFLLNRCGFKIVEHEYFDRKQGDYFIDKKENTIKKHKIRKNLKNVIFQLIKNTGFLVPHLRNHHIILAKKDKNIDEIIQNRKTTTSKEEFLKIRKNILGY
jgi:SAM-dependent methyltransferase|tara:strand:- start:1634 stop:2581 length:948 start_codon:yes stop_codon:yes gene_type:complete